MDDAATSSYLKNDDEIWRWVESIVKEEGVCSLLSINSISRVPPRIRKLKPEAYTPQLVSIGPLHYNEEHLKHMQAYKLCYLKHFPNRHGITTLGDNVEAVSLLKENARKFYLETSGTGFQEGEFVKIMVIDGCFILEFLERMREGGMNGLVSNDLWYLEILHDLINLENQLPFCVLERLHDINQDPFSSPRTLSKDIYEILLSWFALQLYGPKQFPSIQFPQGQPNHILDLLKNVLVESSTRSRTNSTKKLLRTSCALKLKRAGVKFQKKSWSSDSSVTSLFDITFNKDRGELTIPTIVIDDSTEHILRNLIAFEQCQLHTRYFTVYATFMDGLIDTNRDVKLLEEKGIIVNRLGNPEDVVTLFDNIVEYVLNNSTYFSSVIEDVENYQRKPWNKLRAGIIENYFNTPWALISSLAGLFLLIFTVIQTICSILPVVQTKP